MIYLIICKIVVNVNTTNNDLINKSNSDSLYKAKLIIIKIINNKNNGDSVKDL